MERLYYEVCAGRFEAWVYSEGRRYYVLKTYEERQVLKYAKKYGYAALFVGA